MWALFFSWGVSAQTQNPALELVGLWEAKRSFGPEVRGPLELRRLDKQLSAEIAGYRVSAQVDGVQVSFDVPGDRGGFRGELQPDGKIVGHWYQPRTRHAGMQAASPVVLRPNGTDDWLGDVVPFEDDFTVFLVVEEREDGTAGAFLRNPERNFGIFMRADRLEIEDGRLLLVGHWGRSEEEEILSVGSYSGSDQLTLRIRGASYDFRRVDDDPGTTFYARGPEPGPYQYRSPPAFDDGWEVATLDEVGMSLEPIKRLIETVIDAPADTVHAPYVHGMLVARHGKLVFEEYFHGFSRERSHDTRSASKSATSFLVGAAVEAGEPVATSMPVYETIGAPYFSNDLDPRARRMKLENLLTMSSGLDCDDRDPDSPGGEDRMQSQEENTDWYDYTLDLDMIREPGEKAVYCSVNSNLIGKVVSAATGERLETLFQRLIAEPLDIERYHMYLQPTGEPYMGGGIHWMPRDFMKLGQVILDGGTWNGGRVLSEEFASRSIRPLVELRDRGYGYQWWLKELPYRDGTVQAFFAGGNGGQVVMGVPELDLLVSFFAGNYSDPVLYRIQEEFIPEYILPALVPRSPDSMVAD